ncbi:MAG: fibronectin type III domain-containing protein, partial [Brevinema sp.]
MNRYMILLFWIMFTGCVSSSLQDLSNNAFSIIVSEDQIHKITLNWTKMSLYDHYKVFRSDDLLGEYALISGKLTNGVFEDHNVETGKVYYYKVRAYNKKNFALYLTDEAIGISGKKTFFSAPNTISASSGLFNDRIILEWDKVVGAKQYQVLRSQDNVNFDLIATIYFNYYEDKDISGGTTYYYQINSIDADGILSSDRSPIVSGSTFSPQISLFSKGGEFYDKIVLHWEKVPFVEQYKVFRSTIPNFLGHEIAILQSNAITYEDLNVKPSEIYYYTIIYQNTTAMGQSHAIKSYVKSDNAPPKVQNIKASQGEFSDRIVLTWTSFGEHCSYQIDRFSPQDSSWKEIAISQKNTYTDFSFDDAYEYKYRIIAMNPNLGEVSDPVQGWILRSPIGLKASDSYAEKITISWDVAPAVQRYNIYVSEFSDQGFKLLTSYALKDSTQRASFDHRLECDVDQKELYYQVELLTDTQNGPKSPPIKGILKKMPAPQNIKALNNRGANPMINLVWDSVQGARGYRVYRATLKHHQANQKNLQNSDYKLIATTQNNSYPDHLIYFPLRRYVYRIVSLDGDGVEGKSAYSEIVWRVPDTIQEFVKDVDFTILHAQKQIRNFGYNGSSGIIRGRSSGVYHYSAGLTGSKSMWNQYSSFEITINGNPNLKIGISPPGAYMSGSIYITGLYRGKITYDNLFGKEGG